MLKIYGRDRSRAFRVTWLCEELKVPFEHVDAMPEGDASGQQGDRSLELNPDASVPAIDDDGFVLWGATAINIYLARKYRTPLWPSTVEAEGRMLQWAFFLASDVEPPLTTLYEHRFGLPRDKRNAALADDCERRLLDKLGVLERQLRRTSYFGGIRWDLSDFVIASPLYTVYAMKLDLHQVPKVDRWLTTSVQRPSAREAIRLRG
jgi:glutathione S-transferase